MMSSDVMLAPIIKHAFRPSTSILSRQTRTLVRMGYKERLAHAIELADSDRQALAVGLGISVQAVSQALVGSTRALTAENTAKAARVLGVDAYWLATGEGEPRPALMKERAALSLLAVQFGAAFDRLDDRERLIWRSLVDAAKAVGAKPSASSFIATVPADNGPKRSKPRKKAA